MKAIKMSETFAMPCKCRTTDNGIAIDILDSYGDLLIDGENTFEETDLSAVCVAINNHDRLVKERDELIELLKVVMGNYQVDASAIEHEYGDRDYDYDSSYPEDSKLVDDLINKIQGCE